MEDIVPNLVPVGASLLLWLVGQASRPVARGALWALIVTTLMAVPPVAFAASRGFRSLEMVFMVTLLMAMASAGLGLIAFLVGFLTARAAKKEGA